jgi:Flp pilus assembly pilin Flp
MSDLITTAQDNYRNACIEAFVGLQSMGRSFAERSRDSRGQTAAEYMGVLLLVSVIIVAVVKGGIDTKIRDALKTAIDKISGAA